MSDYLPLLKMKGTLVQLGLVSAPHTFNQLDILFSNKTIAASMIGGTPATQDLLELCAKHQILPDVTLIEANQIDWAYEQILAGSGNAEGTRYVIDIKKSLANDSFLPPKE